MTATAEPTVENTPAEELPTAPESLLNDPVMGGLYTGRVVPVFERIQKYNDAVNQEVAGTPSREVDKAIREAKENNTLDESIVPLETAREAAHKAYRDAVEAVRNAYRVNVLHEDAVEEIDPSTIDDIDVLKQLETAVKQVVSVMLQFAEANKDQASIDFLSNLAIPRPGKSTSSTVSTSGEKGKRPRISVVVDGVTYPRLGDLVKETGVDRNKWLAAWEAAGEGSVTFELDGKSYAVTDKSA